MDIAVAGAGIAGLAAASLLARQGHRIVVYDKAPAPAPVGSGLIVQPVGQTVLQAMGLLEEVAAAGAPLSRLYAENMSGRVVLDVRYEALGESVHGLGVHRSTLFDALFGAAADSHVVFERAREIVAVESGTGGRLRLAFDGGGASPAFDLVIDAMGVRSPLIERDDAELPFGALWTNVPFPDAPCFPWDRLSQRYSNADRSSGVMPIGRFKGEERAAAFFWTLRQSEYESWGANGIERWKGEVRALWPDVEPCLDHIHDAEQMIFARYAHDTWSAPVEGRLVHIGDAWHAASPQLGQGANMALLDAYALATVMEERASLEGALELFLKRRAPHVKLYQAISRAFTPVYQSDSKILPAMRDVLVEPVAAAPLAPKWLASLVAGRLGGPPIR